MPIRYTQCTFLSSDNKTDISYVVMESAQQPPWAVVQLVHGMCEYCDRYTDFARYLCQRGFVFCGNDHLGHGRSVRRPEERGYFGQRDGHMHLIEDVHALTERMTQRYPDLPVFLLAHSMGSLIARNLLPLFGQQYAGVILSGTPGPNRLAGAGVRLAAAVSRRKGPLYRSQRLNKMVFGGYNQRIDPVQSPFDWLTHERQIVELYENDEKCNFVFTAAGFGSLFTLMEGAQRRQSYHGAPTDLPLYLIAGEQDPVGQYGRGVQSVYEAYRRAGVKDVSLTLYPQARHEVLNETDRSRVYGDVAAWLESHLPEPR